MNRLEMFRGLFSLEGKVALVPGGAGEIGQAVGEALCAYGAKVILDIHDVMPEIYMTKFGLAGDHWKIRLLRWVEIASARLAHRVLTAEHPKAQLLATHGIPAEKIEVLLNLPDDEIFPPQFVLRSTTGNDLAEEFRLIYHGTVTHRLGLDQVVAALPLLAESIPRLRFQILGEGDQLPELHRQVSQLGLTETVWFSNRFRPIEHLIPSIQEAHLAVLPTRHTVSTDYMLPTKLLEYLVFGIPAIFTPTLTVRHYFGQNHPLYLEATDTRAIAAKIIWIKENYAEAKRLTAGLQDAFFEKYQWSRHKQVYLDLLSRLRTL